MDSALAAHWHRKRIETVADDLSGRDREVFDRVVGLLELAALDGAKLSVKETLSLVPCTAYEWNKAISAVRAGNHVELLERYQTAAAKTRTIGHGHGGKRVLAKEAPVRPYEEVKCYLTSNAKEGTSEEEACRTLGLDFGEYLLDKEKALGSVTPHPALVTAPSPEHKAVVAPLDAETRALISVITMLRSLPKDSRDRVLGAAAIMLRTY